MSDAEDISLTPEGPAPLPSLDDLRVFLAVARSGSFRSAARQLFTSQPTLSRAVSRLEQDLGVRLIERGPRGIELTPSGDLLVAEARNLLDLMASLRSRLRSPRAQTLRIGATATNARQFLTPYLAQWIPQHPEITTTAIAGTDDSLRARLEHGDCDAVIISDRPHGEFRQMHLATVPVLAVIPIGHPLASSGPLPVPLLADQPLLVNGPGFPSFTLLSRAMDVAGLRPQVTYECPVGQTLAAAAEAGMGVAVFGATTPRDSLRVVTRPVTDAVGTPLEFSLYVTWPENAPAFTREFCIGLATFHRTLNAAADPDQPGWTPPQQHPRR